MISNRLVWVALVIIILLPTPAGKFLLEVTSGVMATLLLIPILLGGVGWITWILIKPKMTKCDNCGTSFFSNSINCPLCGANTVQLGELKNKSNDSSESASSATVDITAKDVDE